MHYMSFHLEFPAYVQVQYEYVLVITKLVAAFCLKIRPC